jgi:hypothetical protein
MFATKDGTNLELHINMSDIEYEMETHTGMGFDEALWKCYDNEKILHDKALKRRNQPVKDTLYNILDILDKRINTLNSIQANMVILMSDKKKYSDKEYNKKMKAYIDDFGFSLTKIDSLNL